jgi:pimeloyl-ACP methyl ester carboxylesterase
MAFLDVDGARLWYEVAGEGRPVVLLHAGIADSSMWDEQMRTFALDHRVVRYDLRGFGRSDLPTAGPWSARDDLVALLDALDIGRAALVGCSNGGRVALDCAVATPERVTALALVGPGLTVHDWSDELERVEDAEEAAFEREDYEAVADLMVRTWVDGPRRAPEEVDPGVRERVHAMQRDDARRMGRHLARGGELVPEARLDPPAGTRLSDVQARTLLVVGAEDVDDIHRIANRLVTGIPGARRVTIERAAHVPSMERPDEFDRLVLGFLGESA